MKKRVLGGLYTAGAVLVFAGLFALCWPETVFADEVEGCVYSTNFEKDASLDDAGTLAQAPDEAVDADVTDESDISDLPVGDSLTLEDKSNDGVSSSTKATGVKGDSAEINKTSKTTYVGDTFKLKVTGTTKSVSWSSSKESVASVNSSGKVTAKKVGTCTITASFGNSKLTCKVTVKAAEEKEALTAAKAAYKKMKNAALDNGYSVSKSPTYETVYEEAKDRYKSKFSFTFVNGVYTLCASCSTVSGTQSTLVLWDLYKNGTVFKTWDIGSGTVSGLIAIVKKYN